MAANEKRRSSPAAAAAAPAAAGTDQGRSALSANGVAEGEAEFLLQSGVTDMVREALLKVLEARPEKPVDFLAGYFEKLMQSSPEAATEALSDGGDPQRQLSLDRALWYLGLAHHSHRTAFNNNVHSAYGALGAGAKDKKAGVDGKTYSELLRLLCQDQGASDETLQPLLQKVSCRDHEAVPFDIFRYGVLTCLILLEFLAKADGLYDALDNGSGAADKRVCTAVLGTLEDALHLADVSPPIRCLEAGSKLRPDCLAMAMDRALLERKASAAMKKDEFLKRASSIFVTKVKSIH
ncbi:tubulin polyglutamylase complex subunit 1-like [Protobothrops mucrosquamatus]|uniref:tubulin polyglutamylase complex subunit 1-like n=1 Tax=Protobothrops mucrosquamatus TaxID=103944 RepID=UPI0010FB65AD|nr:tubulin polyglutamylase complex subunit 1-like [Protobothrops mucrosquamatus]